MAQPCSPDLSALAHEGELVVRYTYVGQPEKSRFDISVIMGVLTCQGIDYDSSMGEPIGHISSAANIIVPIRYDRNRPNVIGQIRGIRDNISFDYLDAILLRHLVETEQHYDAVQQLTCPKALKAADNTWQVSVLGFAGYRSMQRTLFIACGEPELNIPPVGPPRSVTDPELRAGSANIAAELAMAAFANMPPFSVPLP